MQLNGKIEKLPKKNDRFIKDFGLNKSLYLMAAPVIVFYIVFHYIPMAGIVIAFKNYSPARGIFGSPWTGHFGFQHFLDFFTSHFFGRLLRNTVLISFYTLIFSFPAPILLALMLNEVNNRRFKKVVQTITYFPHFISLVVVCGLITEFSLSDGLFNYFRNFFGFPARSLLQEAGAFRTIYITSGIWQSIGWGSIVYLAAMAGIDPQLYEAASLDGAKRLGMIWHITLPGIKQTIVLLLIMQVGRMLNVGHEKIILLYNPATYDVADVISSYVYRRGLLEFNWSFSTAVGLFNSIINLALVFLANRVSAKTLGHSLF